MSGRLRSLYPGEILSIPGTHWIGEFMGSRVSLDVVAEGEVPATDGYRAPVVQPIASQ
jgi:hypothetical protein